MKKFLLPVLALALLCNGSMARAAGQNAAQAMQSTDKTAPSYDMKAQSLQDLDDMHKKFVGLAEAIPQEKYTWRPGDGVRSISEVFLHISLANYGILAMKGDAMPSGIDPKSFEKSTTDKAQIIAALNKSFDNAHAAVAALSNADFAKPLPKLGPEANQGDVIYILVTHAHEHLGQSIAYARVNGVVPPWTAEAMKKNKPQD
ncbi:MAG: DinB family protein [Candidatus Acidiferrales bacterium]